MAFLQSFVLPVFFAVAAAVGGGFLGVYVEDSEAGPVVQRVIPDTPAARAGFAEGDRFVSIDGKVTPNRDAFLEVLGSYDPGQAVQIVFDRAGETINKRVVLGKRPKDLEGGEAVREQEAEEEGEEKAKVRVRDTAKAEAAETRATPAPNLRLRGGAQPYLGVQVTDAEGGVGVENVVEGSPAARAGLVEGDVIVRVGRTAVEGVAGLTEALAKTKVGDRTDVVVRRGDDETVTLNVQIGERAASAGAPTPPPVAAPARPREPAAETRREPRAAAARPEAGAVEAEATDETSAVRALRREIRDLRREIAELRKVIDKLDR